MTQDFTVRKIRSRIFASLKHRNFRLFWIGQCISLIGTWMQNIAQSWLVLDLTKSAFWLGVVSMIQFLPPLLFSLHAGAMIDRVSKKKLLIVTQVAMMTLAFFLSIDVLTHTVRLWHILIAAGLLGLANTFDMPARQAFMVELVGKDDLRNAIVLNSSIFNAARVLGPTVAGIIIAQLGNSLCFLLNAISFLPVIAGIAMIRLDSKPCETRISAAGVWHEIRDGLNYVRGTPVVLAAIGLLAVINVFALNFNVLIPLYAKNVFHGGARDFGFLMSANGVGALVSSLILAMRSQEQPTLRNLVVAALALSLFELLLAPIHNFALAYLLLISVGFTMIAFTTTVNSLIQFQTPDHLRGRVMSIYTLVFNGFTPFGSFLSGSSSHLWGASLTMGLGGFISLIFIIALMIKKPALLKG